MNSCEEYICEVKLPIMNNLPFNKLNLTLAILLFSFCIISCSKENLEEEVIGAELIGDWHGETEDGIGFLDIDDFAFTSFVNGQRSGEWRSGYIALETCDKSIYLCEDELNSCRGAFTFTSQVGSTYNFDETLITGDCVEGGTGRIVIVNDKTINYTFLNEAGIESRKATLEKVN